MSNNKYVSVKEFAILTKTTYQSVYKQIQKGYLSPYTIIEDGKTLINIKATEIYPKRKGEQKGELVEQIGELQGEQGEPKGESEREKVELVEPQGKSEREKGEQKGEKVELVEPQGEQGEQDKPPHASYIERIEQLEKELEDARETIRKKDEKIAELAERGFTLAEKIAQLTENSQILQAREQEKKGLFSSIRRLFLPKGNN